MIEIAYSEQALADVERFTSFLKARTDDTATVLDTIFAAIAILATSPYIGRPVRGPIRELIISFGRSGYVALYRIKRNRVEILALKHQAEAGYQPTKDR